VRAVLTEIKRWPSRRIAGARAEAFLLNPFAALGDAASQVIDSEQMAWAKTQAGIYLERFQPYVIRDAAGFPGEVGIDIDMHDGARIRRPFPSDQSLREFVAALEHRLQHNLQLLAWQEFELELDGDSPTHLVELQAALAAREKPPVVIQREQIFDLSNYYDRVVGVGDVEPFISAYIVKRSDDEGWFPANLLPVITSVPRGRNQKLPFP
jgi:hypothetical protein